MKNKSDQLLNYREKAISLWNPVPEYSEAVLASTGYREGGGSPTTWECPKSAGLMLEGLKELSKEGLVLIAILTKLWHFQGKKNAMKTCPLPVLMHNATCNRVQITEATTKNMTKHSCTAVCVQASRNSSKIHNLICGGQKHLEIYLEVDSYQ